MSAPAHRVHYTLAEHLAFEALTDAKHEYFDGQIYAMAGGTPEHAALAGAVGGQLYIGLRDGSRVHSADLRVRMRATGLLTYPDVTVVCGPRLLDEEDAHAVINPTLIVEILSRSTEEYDRGDKFEHYKRLPSMRQYVLVAHDKREIEVWSRGDADVWTRQVGRDGDVVPLASIDAALDVRELYDAAAEPKG